MSLVFIGTYTKGASQGIYCSRFNAATGDLTGLRLAAPMTNPSFLAIHPGRRFLYAVSESSDYRGGKSGAVSAFRIDSETGNLAFLGERSSCGAGPCRLAVDPSGRNVLVANYAGGSLAVFPVKADGTLGDASAVVQHAGSSLDPARQRAPHVHSVQLSADNGFALVSDLGLDRVFLYRFDAAIGSLTANAPLYAEMTAGAGPRHLVLHPQGRYAYAVNELHSTVTAFSWDPSRGSLRELQTLPTLPGDFHGSNSAAEILAHPGGRFVFCSNRGHDSIAVLAIESRQGTLKPIQYQSTGGKVPRHFDIDPTGSYLVVANQDSNNLAVFQVNPDTGSLTPNGQMLEVNSPACLSFL